MARARVRAPAARAEPSGQGRPHEGDVGAAAIIRGLRAVSDFEAEMQMAQMNNHLSGVETIFIPTSPEVSFMASKLVREVWRFGGDVSAFVPEPVAKALAAKYKEGGGKR